MVINFTHFWPVINYVYLLLNIYRLWSKKNKLYKIDCKGCHSFSHFCSPHKQTLGSIFLQPLVTSLYRYPRADFPNKGMIYFVKISSVCKLREKATFFSGKLILVQFLVNYRDIYDDFHTRSGLLDEVRK